MSDALYKRRRQRAVLSCNDCRRRKLKCDRLAPCDRCIKGGVADSCAYGSGVHSVARGEPHERPGKKRRKVASSTHEEQFASENESDVFEQVSQRQPDTAAQERLEKLERDIFLLQQHIPAPAPTQEPRDQIEFLGNSPDLKGINRTSGVMGMLKGRSYGTHYFGASSVMAVIAQFPELRSYMKVAYSNSTARRLSQDIKASEDQARLMQPKGGVLNISSLRSLLPDRRNVDLIVQKYFDTFETTLRIIHVPTFNKDYANYWDTNSTGSTDIDAIILAILACTICTSTHAGPRYNHTGSTFHSKAVLWIRALESWLKQQSNKRRSLATLQVRCLRLLALATASHKVKRYYQEVQAHVAIMRSGGMHRDPIVFGTRCPPFEGEMRRRLWATTMELEIQASVDKGIPSVLGSFDFDCAPPRNIDDEELNIGMLELPRSHGLTTYTDTAYLHVAKQTLELRICMCSKLNALKDDSNLQDTLEHEDALNQNIAKIPRWTDHRSTLSKQLLELQLRQFIVILHAPRALQVESQRKSNCRYAMVTVLQAAASTIVVHSIAIRSGNFSLLLTRLDYFRAILLISRIAYYAHRDNDSIMLCLAKQVFDDSQEKALRLQEERAMRPGRGNEYFWYVSAAVSLVGMQSHPAQSEKLKRLAGDRVAKLLYKELSLRDDPNDETLATEVVLASHELGTAFQSPLEPPAIKSFADAGLQLDAFGFEDTSEFMIEDLWFLNVPQ